MESQDFDNYLFRQVGVLSEADWQQHAAYLRTMARGAKLYHDALIAEGFTPDQAFRIILIHGCSPKLPPPSVQDCFEDDADGG